MIDKITSKKIIRNIAVVGLMLFFSHFLLTISDHDFLFVFRLVFVGVIFVIGILTLAEGEL